MNIVPSQIEIGSVAFSATQCSDKHLGMFKKPRPTSPRGPANYCSGVIENEHTSEEISPYICMHATNNLLFDIS